MKIELAVQYSGYDHRVDDELEKIAKMFKGKEAGAGFDLTNGKRDFFLSFPTEQAAVDASEVMLGNIKTRIKCIFWNAEEEK